MTGYFAYKNITFRKHTQLRGAVHKELIKTGLLPEDIGREYDFLMDLRETGDYGGLSTVSHHAAVMAIEKAEDIISAIKNIYPAIGQ